VSGLIEPAGILDQRDPAILIPDDQIEIAITIPVEGDRDDHLQIHRQRSSAEVFQSPPGGVDRLCSRPGILEVGEAVEKFTRQQVEITIPVEVLEVWRGAAEGIDRLAGGGSFTGGS
jgi:hypothetical protein